MKKTCMLILFLLNLLFLQAQQVKFISVNQAVDTFENITFKRLPKLLAKDSITADTLAEPAKWMVKLSKKLSCKQQKDSNIYIFFVPDRKDSARVFLPLSGKYGYVIFDTTKTGVYCPDSLVKRLRMQKYQWDAIHDPQRVLFAWAQGEEEGAYGSADWTYLVEGIRCAKYNGKSTLNINNLDAQIRQSTLTWNFPRRLTMNLTAI